jgi:thiol-disulfide isomerase/thioredoxin
MMDVLARLLIAVLLILGGLALTGFYRRWTRLRSSGLLTDLGPLRPDTFTLVYFTTPTCIPCKTIQRPAIDGLKNRLGSALQVIEIDATQKPDLANRWGVMSVPTTFVIDPHGEVRHVNHGVTRVERLLQQTQG